MKYNQLTGADTYLYSFEYYGESSLWNFLFPGRLQGYSFQMRVYSETGFRGGMQETNTIRWGGEGGVGFVEVKYCLHYPLEQYTLRQKLNLIWTT